MGASRRGWDQKVGSGETVGLALNAQRLSLFDKASGRAVETALYEGAHG